MIEILTTGAPNTIQDGGRQGHLSSGISRCGAMDRLALDVGNALLGNPVDAAGIEVALFPFRLRFDRDATFALTGADCDAALDGRSVPPFWTRGAKAGQVLSLGPPRRGARAYVAASGGIMVPPVMGSRSTDLKGGFGGLEGRGFRRGDRLDLGGTSGDVSDLGAGFGTALPEWVTASEDAVTLRVIEAAEYEAFTAASRTAFASADWTVGSESNRSGYRLSGPTLELDQPTELFSHGIVPGIVQVPANGQPIVQLADANTCGGYPKIAAVIEADLWRIAQAPVGARLRFVSTAIEDAVAALRTQAAWLAEIRAMAARVRDRAVASSLAGRRKGAA